MKLMIYLVAYLLIGEIVRQVLTFILLKVFPEYAKSTMHIKELNLFEVTLILVAGQIFWPIDIVVVSYLKYLAYKNKKNLTSEES